MLEDLFAAGDRKFVTLFLAFILRIGLRPIAPGGLADRRVRFTGVRCGRVATGAARTTFRPGFRRTFRPAGLRLRNFGQPARQLGFRLAASCGRFTGFVHCFSL